MSGFWRKISLSRSSRSLWSNSSAGTEINIDISINNHYEHPNGGKEHKAEGRREIEIDGIEGSYLHPHEHL
jgi:hypothetical protein